MHSNNFTQILHPRKYAILLLLIITPLGLYFKTAPTLFWGWANNYGAGLLYSTFWCLLLFILWPHKKWATQIALAVLITNSLIEILQLWQPPFLQSIRATLIGRALLGSTFGWWDFPHYMLGSFLGWLFIKSQKG